MPLKIQLKPKERVIINGAVIEGHADNRTEIVVMNNASVMRQKHILQEPDANTPCKRLYFTLQMLYIDEDNRAQYQPSFENFFKDLNDTFSIETMKTSLQLIREAVDKHKYYEALKVTRDLIKVEAELLKIANPLGDEIGE